MTRGSIRHTMNHKDLLGLFRSSHQRCSVKKGVLKNVANFTGMHLCWSLFLITLQIFRPVTLLKRYSNTDSMKFVKFLKTPLLKDICNRLLLFVLSQNTIANSGGEFGLDETSAECKVSILLNVITLSN